MKVSKHPKFSLIHLQPTKLTLILCFRSLHIRHSRFHIYIPHGHNGLCSLLSLVIYHPNLLPHNELRYGGHSELGAWSSSICSSCKAWRTKKGPRCSEYDETVSYSLLLVEPSMLIRNQLTNRIDATYDLFCTRYLCFSLGRWQPALLDCDD